MSIEGRLGTFNYSSPPGHVNKVGKLALYGWGMHKYPRNGVVTNTPGFSAWGVVTRLQHGTHHLLSTHRNTRTVWYLLSTL